VSTAAGLGPSFLGTGWGFPPAFSAGGAEVEMVSDDDDIHESLQLLLATRRGERVMQERYGCNLDECLFAEIDHALIQQVESLIHDAILRDEPRVELLDLDVSPDPNQASVLRIEMSYSIHQTNSRYNMVFPFYLNEAVASGV
jgi:phage baseplate assembly protein W